VRLQYVADAVGEHDGSGQRVGLVKLLGSFYEGMPFADFVVGRHIGSLPLMVRLFRCWSFGGVDVNI